MKKLLPILTFCLFCLNCEQGWLKDILIPVVEGCTDSNSCNYNSDAEEDDGSCIAKQGCNNEWCEGDSLAAQELDCNGVCGGTVFDSDGDGICDRLRLLKGEYDTSIVKVILTFSYSKPSDINGYYLIRNSNEVGRLDNYTIVEDVEGSFQGGKTIEYMDSTSLVAQLVYQIKALDDSNNSHYSNELIVSINCDEVICDSDETNQTDCSDPYTCSNCTGCESSCCPNYCSGNYYYYNRSCSNGFCVGATSDYCSDGCNDDGCIESTYGCTNPSACNFDANATIFDDSCWSATDGCECSDGEGSVADECGTCDNDLLNDCVMDCNNEWGGTAVLSGCDNLCNSTKENDCAGVCGGTHAGSDCGTVTDIDGNTYKTIKIGEQNWMAENLKVTHYQNGDEIFNVINFDDWGNLFTGGYAYYNNNSSYLETYGNLYNWYTVDDERNTCPEDWHVPTDDEWKQLEIYLGMSQEEADETANRGTNEGTKLKDIVFDGTNESGFAALGGGYFGINFGYYDTIGGHGYFWTSSAFSSSEAWNRALFESSPMIYRYNTFIKHNAFSIRCLKD